MIHPRQKPVLAELRIQQGGILRHADVLARGAGQVVEVVRDLHLVHPAEFAVSDRQTPPPVGGLRERLEGRIAILDPPRGVDDRPAHRQVDEEALEALLSSKGVANDQTIVLYGGNNNWFAAYAYWYLKLYGHGDVRLLDGGRKKWELDGRELVTDVTTRPATQYRAKDQDRSLRAFRDDVVAAIGGASLVDVRSPDEYAGRLLAPAHLPQETSQVPGHVPTARNIPWSKAANEDGTFKSDAELTALYESAGVNLSGDVIAYCRIGERSSHSWFVLREILGVKNVRNYDGSWTEYGSLVGVPVALGDEPGAA